MHTAQTSLYALRTYNDDTRECVSILEAARLLGIGRTRTYDLVNSGDLRAIRLGGRRLVIRASIRELVRRLDRESEDAA